MTAYLSLEQGLVIGEIATGDVPEVRDLGLLDSALHRPQSQMFGVEAYPDAFDKCAALLHSLARNHPFVDGNKRLAWLSCAVFCRKNGIRLEATQDEVYDFVIAVASGELTEIQQIAAVLRRFAGAAR
jgi:death-on-curing protein